MSDEEGTTGTFLVKEGTDAEGSHVQMVGHVKASNDAMDQDHLRVRRRSLFLPEHVLFKLSSFCMSFRVS